ncbi:MAG: trigger factor [Bacilli bacterium]|nr:trigger factor [Bacilli bacterium]
MAKKDNKHEIIVKIEGESWESALDKAFKEEVKKVNVDGFRKGKVPRDVFEKRYGKERLYIPAVDYVIEEAYVKAIEDSKLIPVVQPKLEIVSVNESGVEIKFIITTKPEVKIKKYKGLGIKPEKVKVTKEEIEHELGHILERYSELKVKEGSVEEGNIAIIDFEGFKDGVAFEGGKGENYELEIGSHTFIPGFEEQLVGMNTNEEKEIEVTFPEEYPAEELKGAKATFKVKVNEIKEKVARDFDEELFEDLGMEGVDSKESLEKEIEANIKAHKEVDSENKYVDALLEAVGKNTEVDIPEEMVEEEVDRLLHRFEEQIKMQGISLELYYQFTNSKEEDLRNQLEKEAYNHVLYRLMLEEVAILEKIEITDEEAEKEADNLSSKYQMEKEEFLKMFGGLDMIKYDLEMRRVIDLLKELNK